MNFQERFRGKTSTISKEGIDGLVQSTVNPVRKDNSTSYTISQLPQVVSTTSLDNSPKRQRKIPLSTTNGTRTSVIIADPSLPTPKSFTPNTALGNLRYRLADIQNQFEPPRALPTHNTGNKPSMLASNDGVGFTRQTGPIKQRERPLNRRSANGIGTKSANQSQLYSEPFLSDHSGMNFNPNSFYNQHTQIRTSGRTLSELQPMQPPSQIELKANRNHLHRKSFENLSQQNKQKHISQDVFKNIVKPTYQYVSDQYEGQNEFSQQKTMRLYDSLQQQQRPERSVSYNSGHHTDMNLYQMANEPYTIREMNRADSRHAYRDDRSAGHSSPQNDQMIVLSRMKYRPPNSMEGFNVKKVCFKDNDKDVVKFSRLQETTKSTHINLGSMYTSNNVNKPKSPEKVRPTWGGPIEATFK